MSAECSQCHSPLPVLPPELEAGGGTVLCRVCGTENELQPPVNPSGVTEELSQVSGRPRTAAPQLLAEDPTLSAAAASPWSTGEAAAPPKQADGGFVGQSTAMFSPERLKALREGSLTASTSAATGGEAQKFWEDNPTGLFDMGVAGDGSAKPATGAQPAVGAMPLEATLQPALVDAATPSGAAMPAPQATLGAAVPPPPPPPAGVDPLSLPPLTRDGAAAAPQPGAIKRRARLPLLAAAVTVMLLLLGGLLLYGRLAGRVSDAASLQLHIDNRDHLAKISAVHATLEPLRNGHRALVLQGELQGVAPSAVEAPTAVVELRDGSGAIVANVEAPVGFVPTPEQIGGLESAADYAQLGTAWKAAQPPSWQVPARFTLVLYDPPQPMAAMSPYVHLAPPPPPPPSTVKPPAAKPPAAKSSATKLSLPHPAAASHAPRHAGPAHRVGIGKRPHPARRHAPARPHGRAH